MGLKIRLYKTGDAEKIYSFFARSSSYKRDAPFWVWINRALSAENSIIAVAETEDFKIVGHYAIIPREFNYNGNVIKAGLGIHAMIDVDFRNECSIFQIASLAYDNAKAKGIQFVYGFPNKHYRLIQEKIERWKKISLFNAWEKKAIISNTIQNSSFYWKDIDPNNYDDIFLLNELVEKEKVGAFQFTKPLFYIINRYLRHPQSVYRNFLLFSEKKVVGFVVMKIYTDNEFSTSAHIVDMILPSNDLQITVLHDFEKMVIKSVNKIVLWPGIFDDNLLSENMYTQTGFDTFFGIKILDQSISDAPFLSANFKEWRLVMGDSDAF